MKLSLIVSSYRIEHELSQREFAKMCGLSNSYISFIEKEVNPKTGRPIVPTLEQYKKIASAMGLSVHSLFEKLDSDSPVSLSPSTEDLSVEESHLVDVYRKASPESRKNAVLILETSAREMEAFRQESENAGSA